MVNQVVLKYFRDNMAKHSVGDLREGASRGGYSGKDIDEAVVALKSGGNAPMIKKNPVAPSAVVGVRRKTSGVKWMRFAGILGIIFLVFGVLNVIGELFGFKLFSMIGSFLPWFSLGLLVVLVILSCFYYFGFVRMGHAVDSKLLKVSAIMNIISILLLVVLFGLLIFALQDFLAGGTRGGFFDSVGISISLWVFGALSILFIFVTRIIFSISLIRVRKNINFALVSGILGLVLIGSVLAVLGLFVYVTFGSFIMMGIGGVMFLLVLLSWAQIGILVIGFVELLFESLALFSGSKKFEN